MGFISLGRSRGGNSIMMKFYILMLFASATAFASGDHGAEESAKIGKGVIAYDEHDGFKLSPEAIKQFAFTYKKVEKNGTITLSKESVAFVLDETQVYLLINGFYKVVDVQIVSKSKNEITVKSEELKTGTDVVTSGVTFLRVITMDLNAGEESGHGHG